ncbi:MAG: PAS domain-containing protein [Actinobacteria bacterium]|nr:PAS domain-containing protein [Actinomycetota bacterium]
MASAEPFRDIVEGVQAVTYLDADDDINTLYISPQIEDMLGYPPEEWIADPDLWLERTHPDDRDWVYEESLLHTAKTGPYHVEYRMIAADGRVVWIRDHADVVRDSDGNPVFWRGVMLDVTELKETYERLRNSLGMLRHSMAERRLLLRRIEGSAEQERRSIAGNIHDDSIQVMASVSLRLQALHELLPESRRPASDEIREMVDESIDRLRHLVFELRPVALESKGLVPALRQYLEHAGAAAGFDYRIEDKLDDEPSIELRIQLYRIAQEAITNIGKHADAGLAVVKLETRGSGIGVTIQDDGKGFGLRPIEAGHGHFGFSAMRERAEMAGGIFDVRSEPGKGVTVEFWLPSEIADLPEQTAPEDM